MRHCPAHHDDDPSLSVREKRDKVLVHCHAGCTQEWVIEALRELGLWGASGQKDHQARLDTAAVQRYIRRLHGHGVHVLRCWGGGKALPGTDHRKLAKIPPALETMLVADYSGGLAILLGTGNREAGYLMGVDVDHGPGEAPAWPAGTIYAEAGTRDGAWHIFVRTRDRLDGQRNLVGPDGQLAVELKGLGRSLRAWPTVPPGKARGYRPVFMVSEPVQVVLSVDELERWARETAGLPSVARYAPASPPTQASGSARPADLNLYRRVQP